MRKLVLLTLFNSLFIPFLNAQKAKVVVLGVGHSVQLVNFGQQPAAIRAFVERVKPSGICVERSPEEFSKNDFYEFTYEQQYVLLPYAKQKSIPLHPIDWIPSENDMDLAFGIKDLEVPAFTRQKSGFLGFTVFTEKNDFDADLYFADKQSYRDSIASWYETNPEKTSFDFPRRLFLYRTFLQARRIQKVLENYKESDTVLVVIGAFHKNDIEKNLKENGYEILQPSSFGTITEKEIHDNFKKEDAFAILSFNLLGMQSYLGKVNTKLTEYAFEHLKDDNSAETAFLKIKYGLYQKKVSSKEAVSLYRSLLDNVGEQKFSWNGVKNKSRIDSYFDPFGNLSLKQRIILELARELFNSANKEKYKNEIQLLTAAFKGYQKQMLETYIEQIIK
ncbi:hypothetical protein [Flavobacterium foetidum]|uniref:hypothetical protein n=1 Tax=Flavobacterium foetidum TaxID=2026681 RepID=UPI00107541F2|nr:hypothetical protein [Flavobacterium foetidum]KAF2514874.1 hypothetical protein E0W73_10595 [Flavobacterium foetidum]